MPKTVLHKAQKRFDATAHPPGNACGWQAFFASLRKAVDHRKWNLARMLALMLVLGISSTAYAQSNPQNDPQIAVSEGENIAHPEVENDAYIDEERDADENAAVATPLPSDAAAPLDDIDARFGDEEAVAPKPAKMDATPTAVDDIDARFGDDAGDAPVTPVAESASESATDVAPDASPLMASAPAAEGKKVPLVERSDETLFILEAMIGRDLVVDQSLLAYVDDSEVLLPLSRLANDFMFQFKVDPASGFAEGWFIKEENTFRLHYPYKTVEIRGEQIPIEGTVESHSDDIYVSLTELQKWFPVKLALNFNELRLYIEPGEELPFQELATRHQRWEKAKSRKAPNPFDDKDLIVLPYRKFAAPNIQVQHDFGYNRAGGQQTGNYSTSVQSQGDLLGMNARMNLTHLGDTEEHKTGNFDSAYVNFSKNDYRSNLLGFMHATEFELGDMTSSSMPLANGNQSGRGVSASNAPYNFVRDPNQFIIEGFAPAGWDAEVYLDERLLSFQTVDVDGRYRFEDLELRDGFNLFRIVLYGPNGEKEERYERFYLGQNMVDKGDFIYEISALESSTPLFPLQGEEPTDPTLSLIGEYGVTDDLSAHVGYFTGPDGPETMNALGTGLRLSTASAYFQFDALVDASGAFSGGTNATGNLTETIYWNAGHTEHHGFAPNQRPIAKESYFRFSQRFDGDHVKFGSYSLGAKRTISEQGVITYSLTNDLSGVLFDANINNEVEHEFTEAGAFERTTGELTIRRRTAIGMFRGRLNYNWKGTSLEFENIDLLYQTQLNETTAINFGINSSFVGEQLNTIAGSLNKRFDKFTLSAGASVDDKGDGQVNLGLAYNFIPQSLYGDYIMSGNTGDLNMGILQVEPFVDTNENGIREEDEEVVPGITLKNMLRGTKGVSGENGVVSLPGLQPDMANRILMDVKTIPSIYMTPAKEFLQVFGKPGVGGPIGYPLILLGEMTGTLYRVGTGANENELEPLPNVQMVLLDENDKAVAETITEYDGFFVLPSLHLGKYRVYFPASAEIAQYHQGDGNGPAFELTHDATEKVMDIVVLSNTVVDHEALTPEQIRDERAKHPQEIYGPPTAEQAAAGEAQSAMLPAIPAESADGSYSMEGLALTPEAQQAEAVPVPEVVSAPDTAMPEATAPASTSAATPAPAGPVKPVEPVKHYIQAGLFCDAANAERWLETVLAAGLDATKQPREHEGKTCYAIAVPEAGSRKHTDAIIEYLRELGFDGAFYAEENP